jgi:carbonic anhydrase
MYKNFVTCLNCIDGRIQFPVIKWIDENFNTTIVDMITEPGMDKILSDNSENIDEILNQITISVNMHNSTKIFIVGHHDCARNQVTENEHILQIENAVKKIHKIYPELPVYGLWVSNNWVVEKTFEILPESLKV